MREKQEFDAYIACNFFCFVLKNMNLINTLSVHVYNPLNRYNMNWCSRSIYVRAVWPSKWLLCSAQALSDFQSEHRAPARLVHLFLQRYRWDGCSDLSSQHFKDRHFLLPLIMEIAATHSTIRNQNNSTNTTILVWINRWYIGIGKTTTCLIGHDESIPFNWCVP